MKTTMTAALAMSTLAVGALSACSSGGGGSEVSQSSNRASTQTTSVVQQLNNSSVVSVKKTLPTSDAADTIRTPDGSWRITFGKPASNLNYDGVTYAAPSGSLAMPVSWLFTPNPPTTTGGTSIAPSTPMTSIFVGDTKRGIRLTSNPTTSGTAIVAMSDKLAPKASATVSFDGVNQNVNHDGKRDTTASAADAYYDGLQNVGRGQCPQVKSNFTGTGGQYTGTCGFASIVRVPWLPGKGWAGKSKTWVQVTGIVNPGSMTWTDKIDGKNVITNYSAKGALTGGELAGVQTTEVTHQGDAGYIMTFAAPSGTGSLSLKVNEMLTGTSTTPIKAPMSAPTTQQVSVSIVTPLTFQQNVSG